MGNAEVKKCRHKNVNRKYSYSNAAYPSFGAISETLLFLRASLMTSGHHDLPILELLLNNI